MPSSTSLRLPGVMGVGGSGDWPRRHKRRHRIVRPGDALRRLHTPPPLEECASQVPDAGVARAASVGTESRLSVGSEVPTVLDERRLARTLALKSTARS